MKTLSFLGAVFLPGTYLASVFGMSFFNFEESKTNSPPPLSFLSKTSLLKPLICRSCSRLRQIVDLFRHYRPHHGLHCHLVDVVRPPPRGSAPPV